MSHEKTFRQLMRNDWATVRGLKVVFFWLEPILPTYSIPNNHSLLKHKLLWTTAALLVCIVGIRVPLYGPSLEAIPPRFYKRPHGDDAVPTASIPGSIMDLGVAPIISASLSIEFLRMIGILHFNLQLHLHRVLLGNMKSCLALIVLTGRSFYNVSNGSYGSPSSLGTARCTLVLLQLMAAAYTLVFMCGLPKPGYRPNALICLFIAAVYQYDVQDSLYQSRVGLKKQLIIAALHIPLVLLELLVAVLKSIVTIFSTALAILLVSTVTLKLWRRRFKETDVEADAKRAVDEEHLNMFYYSISLHVDDPNRTSEEFPKALDRLLNSNDLPSDDQAMTVRRVIQAAQSDLDRLSGRTATVSSLPRHDADVVVAFIDKWRSTLSVVRRVPPEVLTEIFWWMSKARASSSSPTNVVRPLSSVPWAAAQVCRQWRETVQSSPELWTRLPAVDLTRSDQIFVARQVSLLSDFILRSSHRKLEVCIWAPELDCATHPLLAFIAGSSQYWEKLSIFPTYPTIQGLLAVQVHLPSLARLTLNFGTSGVAHQPGSSERLSLFSAAPCLHHVTIHGQHNGDIELPIDQLDVLEDERLSSMRYIPTGPHTYSKLLIFSAVAGKLPAPEIQSTDALQFPELALLRLAGHLGGQPTDFLSRAVFPTLGWLEVVADASCRGVFGTVQAAITRSACTSLRRLTVLQITGRLPNPEDALIPLLHATPNLKHLTVALPVLDDIMQLVVEHGETPTLVPTLERCTFVAARQIDRATMDALHRLGSSRRPQACGWLFLSSPNPHEFRALPATAFFNPVPWPYLRQAVFRQGEGEEIMRKLPCAAALRRLSERLYGIIRDDKDSQLSYIEIGGFMASTDATSDIKALLSEILALEPTDVREIMICSIHIAISWVAMRSHEITSIFYLFNNLIIDIVEKWTPLFEKGSQQICWAWNLFTLEMTELEFVPQGCASRNHPLFVDFLMGNPKQKLLFLAA